MKYSVVEFSRSCRNRLSLLTAIRKNVSIGTNLHVGPGSILEAPRHLTVGNDVYIGKHCTIECDGAIGNGVLIANLVGLIGRYDHDYSIVGVPVRHSPWIGHEDYHGLGQNLEIVIEDDVWIGYGATVLSGVKIGRGAIIAAGSIVTRDISPYGIAVGNPAKVKKYRFTQEQIIEHEKLLTQHKSTQS